MKASILSLHMIIVKFRLFESHLINMELKVTSLYSFFEVKMSLQ